MNQDQQLSSIKILVIIGFTLIAFSLTLGIATYAVPYWVTYSAKVVTGSLQDWINYNRSKGIFQECVVNPAFPRK